MLPYTLVLSDRPELIVSTDTEVSFLDIESRASETAWCLAECELSLECTDG